MRLLQVLPTLLSTASLISARISPFSSEPFSHPGALHRRQATNTTWPYQTFKTEPTFLPPVLEITGKSPTPLPIFFAQICTTCAQQAATIFTPTGDLIWQSDPNTPFPATNFIPQQLNGKPVFTYNLAVGEPLVASGALVYSIVLIYDDSYNLLHNISVRDPTFFYAPGNDNTSVIDGHEAYITPQNTLLVPAYNITPWDLSPVGGPKDGWILDGVVYEVSIPEGKVLWSWKSSDHIGIEDAFVPLDAVYGYGNSSASAWDYFHVNSIQTFGDDGFVITARNTWDVMYINKTTKHVDWRLRGSGEGGDFALDEAAQFRWQHDARLYEQDGELLLSIFDNRNSLEPPYVPAVGTLLTMDLEVKTAKIKQLYVRPNITIASQFGGSMQVNFDDKYVILGHGSQPIVVEYNLDGTFSTSWRFGAAMPDFGIPAIAGYRAYKSAWKGYPTTAPAAKACKTATGTDVYVSWNGATEVKSWTVFAGQDEVSLLQSASAPKSGFETKISLDEVVAFVKVQAVGDAQDERFTAQSSAVVAVQDVC